MYDDFAAGYQPAEYGNRLEDGEHRVKIKDVNQDTSSKGNSMLVIELSIENASFTVKHFIVKNEYFNANATQFFDAFGIPRGNFDYPRWVGRTGKAFLKRNEKGYMDLKYLVVKQTNQPPAPPSAPPSAPPAQRPPAQRPAPQDDFDDDIPF